MPKKEDQIAPTKTGNETSSGSEAQAGDKVASTVLPDHGVERYVDKDGNSIVVHADGRFIHNRWTDTWERIGDS